MATNLLIGVPDIPLAAVVTPSVAPLAAYPAANLFGGNRTDQVRYAPLSGGSTQLAFALSSAKAADFLFVGNADMLKGEGVTSLSLNRNSVNTYGTSAAVSAHTLASTTLYGPNGSDLINTFTATPAAQYWWLTYVKASGTFTNAHSFVYFGTALDLGRDPDEGVKLSRASKAGAFQRKPLYTVELNWSGVSYAKAVAFYQQVVKPRRHQPVVLFTRTYHGLLSGQRVLLCRVTDAGMPPTLTNVNDLSLTVEELL